MTISVHSLNHPIIQVYISTIINVPLTALDAIRLWRMVFMFLFYETLRKSISVTKLYLRSVFYDSEIYIDLNTDKVAILTEDFIYQMVVHDIYLMLPNSRVYPIFSTNHDEQHKIQQIQSFSNDFKELLFDNNQFIIVHKVLHVKSIISFLNWIASHETDYLSHITICCVSCSIEDLQLLGNHFKDINIFTLQILDSSVAVSLISAR